MIRLLLGSAAALGGLGLAAVYAGSDLVTGSNGAPMIVDGGAPASLQAALFDGGACASTLLYGEHSLARDEHGGVRVVAFGLTAEGDVIELGMRDTPGAASATVALLFDEDGKLIAVSKPETLAPHVAEAGCEGAPETADGAPI